LRHAACVRITPLGGCACAFFGAGVACGTLSPAAGDRGIPMGSLRRARALRSAARPVIGLVELLVERPGHGEKRCARERGHVVLLDRHYDRGQTARATALAE